MVPAVVYPTSCPNEGVMRKSRLWLIGPFLLLLAAAGSMEAQCPPDQVRLGPSGVPNEEIGTNAGNALLAYLPITPGTDACLCEIGGEFAAIGPAGTQFVFGLYSQSEGGPDLLLTDTGSFSPQTGEQSSSAPVSTVVTLESGLEYWIVGRAEADGFRIALLEVEPPNGLTGFWVRETTEPFPAMSSPWGPLAGFTEQVPVVFACVDDSGACAESSCGRALLTSAPTVSRIGLLALAGLLGAAGVTVLRRRSVALLWRGAPRRHRAAGHF